MMGVTRAKICNRQSQSLHFHADLSIRDADAPWVPATAEVVSHVVRDTSGPKQTRPQNEDSGGGQGHRDGQDQADGGQDRHGRGDECGSNIVLRPRGGTPGRRGGFSHGM
jgi:hypothetical protein